MNISRVERLLQTNGPALSSSISEALVREGATASNARKLIQRAGKNVTALYGIRFAHNDRFLYMKSDFRSPRFWESLLESFEKKDSVHGLAIWAMQARDGIVARAHFDVVCGSPIQMKRQVGAENVLKALLEIQIVELSEHAEFGPCVVLMLDAIAGWHPPKPSAARARMLAEDLVLGGLREWARNIALGSFEKVEIRSTEQGAAFGQFRWDLTAPSYVRPLSRYDRTKKKG